MRPKIPVDQHPLRQCHDGNASDAPRMVSLTRAVDGVQTGTLTATENAAPVLEPCREGVMTGVLPSAAAD